MQRIYPLLLVLSCFWVSLSAQLQPEPISIPMRDGQTLAAHLYRPNTTNAFPVILIQTPYNKQFFQNIGLPLGVGNDLANSSYAFVIVDWRCFFGSTLACTGNVNRGEDGYDAVEWIAEQSWSNGKIGTWGPSALGNVQFETARENPPHLVCAVPEVASPTTKYQDYLPGGSARVEYLETLGFLFGSAGFDLVLQNPYYNFLWQIVEASSMYPEEIEVPMLLVAGWFDHNTTIDLDLINALASQSPASVQDQHKILIGPWVHGGTGPSNLGSTQQGDLSFPEAQNWNDQFALEFFDYYLRDQANGWEQKARYTYFQMGNNDWRSSTVWPPVGLEEQRWYLQPNAGLSPEAPTQANGQTAWVYDPTDPSPTIGGKTLNPLLIQGPVDQWEVEMRSDALVFTSAVLESPLSIQGRILADLFVSSDRKDTDLCLRLTDVYPDGRSILLGESILRLRFREGFGVNDTSFLMAGTIYPVQLEFEDLATTFLPGHRLRLIVTSSNYPRYNRNMNTGGLMYPDGNMDTLVNPLTAQNTIYFNTAYPSSLRLPIAATISELKEPNPATALSLFPNPADNWLQLAAPAGLVKIFNSQGQCVWFGEWTGGRAIIGIQQLRPGWYVVQWLGRDQESRSQVFFKY